MGAVKEHFFSRIDRIDYAFNHLTAHLHEDFDSDLIEKDLREIKTCVDEILPLFEGADHGKKG